MTYYAGTYGLGPIGIPNDEPRIVCDGCGLVRYVMSARDKAFPIWFLNGKQPPRWSRVNEGTIVDPAVRHYCKDCKR